MKIIKIWLKRLLNWRFLICFGIAWMITNGWAYIFISLGAILKIDWMRNIGVGYMALLWMPWTPEKLITIPIAIWLLKKIFPKNYELIAELENELSKLKKKNPSVRRRKK